MEPYESIERFLQSIETEYQGEARRVHAIAVGEGLLLDPADIDRLHAATARAHAAKAIRSALALVGESSNEVILRRISYLLEEALHDKDVHRSALSVYFDILRRLRLAH